MSFIDSIFGKPTAAPSAPSEGNPGAAQTQMQTSEPISIPGLPNQQQPAPVTTATPIQPLDEFKGLWDTDPNALPPTTPLNFNITPQQMQEISAKLDFSGVVSNDLQQRIAAGGQDAIAAMQESNNNLARAIYEQSALTTTKLVQTAVEHSTKNLEELIATKFKTMGLAESTATLNPALNHPAVQPLVKDAQQRIIQKYPNATQAEIASMTNKYFEQVGAAFNPKMATKANAPTPVGMQSYQPQQETDWLAFLS